MGGISHVIYNMTAIQYLERKQRLQNTTYVRKNGQGFRLVYGNPIPESDFQAANKLPVRLYMSADNPCKKHQYLDV